MYEESCQKAAASKRSLDELEENDAVVDTSLEFSRLNLSVIEAEFAHVNISSTQVDNHFQDECSSDDERDYEEGFIFDQSYSIDAIDDNENQVFVESSSEIYWTDEVLKMLDDLDDQGEKFIIKKGRLEFRNKYL
ncbi:hypothetical protein INT47_003938 [Mucor saturninus]|uniref:Uncharacterized protein n=1 Tax=Mucor saturninus TaxID=64648 RepID=A0A8H7UMJ8_9FUNG|nr:hypothetical protein INT47_003938 [Mucor saturninus]